MIVSERSIGTKNESSLHNALKMYYARRGQIETIRAGYVCDAIGGKGEAIEIQTGHFASLKKKIPALTEYGKVRLIYPIIVTKIIELYDTRKRLLSRRKSPKKGNIWDIFKEMVYVPELIRHNNLTIELVYVEVIERRRNDGMGSWRRKGVSITDRILVSLKEGIVLQKEADWKQYFLPVQGEYSTKILATAANIRLTSARKAIYTLEKAGMLEKTCKAGRNWMYKVR